MVISIFASLFSIGANLLLGYVAFRSNQKSATNRLLAILTIILSLWIVTNWFSLNSATTDQTLFWIRAVMIVTTPLGPILYLFLKVFPDQKLKINNKTYLSLFIGITLVILVSISKFTFPSVAISKSGTITPQIGVGILTYLTFTVTFVLAGFAKIYSKFSTASGMLKEQLKYLVLGVIATFSLQIVTNLLAVVLLNNSKLVALGPISSLLLIGLITYAVVKHRLLDIRLVIARTMSFSLFIVVVISTYVGIIFAAGKYIFSSGLTTTQTIISALITVTIALSFQSVRKYLEKVTDKIFYHDNYDPQKVLALLTKSISSSLDIEKTGKEISDILMNNLRLRFASLVVGNTDSIHHLINSHKSELVQSNHLEILTTIEKANKSQKIILFEDLPESDLKKIMREFRIGCVVNLSLKEVKIGHLLLGEKQNGRLFTEKDLQFLTIFGSELSISINNSLAFEEIREFNLTLKDEVERATAKLKAANERLKELDQVKDEFVSIASHELRTPLTSIRNYQWMLLNNKGGKLTEKQRYYTERSYQSTNRLTKLVTDMLNVSRIDSGRLLLDVSKLQLPEMTKDILVELQAKIKEKNIKTIHQHPVENKLPFVLADADKIKEVIINLIYNALKFTPEKGKIEISYKHDKKLVTMMIRDTGIGIDKTYLPSLFTKFGFVKDSLQSNHPSTESTGLGLYISKSIVELHGGKIWAESEGLNQGTTFVFTLPVYTEEQYQLLHKRYKKEKDAGLLHNSIS